MNNDWADFKTHRKLNAINLNIKDLKNKPISDNAIDAIINEIKNINNTLNKILEKIK